MDSVLTLIAADPGGLDDRLLGRIRSALEDLGADTLSPAWLAEGRAADLPFSLLAHGQAAAAARQLIGEQRIDLVSQPVAHRRKKLLLADMDSTIVVGETLDELAAFAGLKEAIAAITWRAMNGEIDFGQSLRERVALLKDLPESHIEEATQRLTYTPGARRLVATMKAHGAYTVLVSGGFSAFTARAVADCGFDRTLCNRLEVDGGRLTGRVAEPIFDRGAKLQALLSIAAERRLPLTRTLAVGDGANDLDMIMAAGLGLAFRAKPAVAAEARARINHGDLTALLFAQGYREDEFVEG